MGTVTTRSYWFEVLDMIKTPVYWLNRHQGKEVNNEHESI